MSQSPLWWQIARVPKTRYAGKRLAGGLLDFLFPARCGGCLRPGERFCRQCRSQIQPVGPTVCRRCGCPLDRASTCAACQQGGFHVSALRATALYQPPLSTAIRRFKYHGRRELADCLGELLAGYWLARNVSADLVAAVPLHPERLSARGYNQAYLLAEAFCRRVGMPLLEPGVLTRQRATQQQVLLNGNERQRNVAGAFAWDGPPLPGARVLLIDDVATTGATLEACGEVLIPAGAARVWGLAVARSGGGDDLAPEG